jgi:hypothetical protein
MVGFVWGFRWLIHVVENSLLGLHGQWQALHKPPHYAVSLKKYSSRMPLGFYREGVTLDVL